MQVSLLSCTKVYDAPIETRLSAATMTAKFIVLGSTDEVNTCDCCGKSNLKATWAVEMIDAPEGGVLYYGSTCVTRNTGKTMKEIRSEVEAAHKAKIDSARAEFAAHPANLAHKAKMEEGYRLKLQPGKEFLAFHRAEMLEANKVKAAIADKHGIAVYQIV